MSSGRVRRELGGEPGGTFVKYSDVPETMSSDGKDVPVEGRTIGAWFSCALAAAITFFPSGSVPLQQSSSVEGRHFPRLQQSAAAFVYLPPVAQSNGLISRKTARTVTAM